MEMGKPPAFFKGVFSLRTVCRRQGELLGQGKGIGVHPARFGRALGCDLLAKSDNFGIFFVMAKRSTRPSSARANTDAAPDFAAVWMAGSWAGHDEWGCLPALMPEIAAATVLLASKMAFAAFAGELFSDIRRNTANRRLERALGFVVEMLWYWVGLGFVGGRL